MRVEKAIKQKPNKLDYCCFVAVFINDFSISTLLLGCLSILLLSHCRFGVRQSNWPVNS